MHTIDLRFFLEPPVLTTTALLEIDTLAPLSMVAAQPGAYYRSQPAPTDFMLYGLLENALGWHLPGSARKQVIDGLKKQVKKVSKTNKAWSDSPWTKDKPIASPEAGFISLLQYHVQFVGPHVFPAVVTYDDFWSQQLRDTGRSFFGGSRHYDASLSDLMTREKRAEVEFGDRAEHKLLTEEELRQVCNGAQIQYKSIRDRFPHYYVSPTVREYVIPHKPYLFRLQTTPTVSALLMSAFADPAAPLYLGSNDGWVEVCYEEL
jgi:CRISPR-associated protein Cas5